MVLRSWSSSNLSGRLIGVAFVVGLGFAAVWGYRILAGMH